MGKKRVFVLILLSLAVIYISSTAKAAEIKASDVSAKPTEFAKVKKEPDSTLLGHWQCTHKRYDMKKGEYFPEPIEYWLVKYNNQYGIYFYRHKAYAETYKGWRNWTINGDQITSGREASIFTKDGEVYYRWRNDKPTKMVRIDENT